MNKRTFSWNLVLMIGTLIVGVIGYARVPTAIPVAIHFDLAGEPNGWAPPLLGFFGLPALSAVFLALRWFIPIRDARAANIGNSAKGFVVIWLSLQTLLLVAEMMIVAHAFGIRVVIGQGMLISSGALLLSAGTLLAAPVCNFTFGTAPPLDERERQARDLSYRFVGRVSQASGVILLATAALTLPAIVQISLPGLALAITIIAAISQSHRSGE